MITVLVVDDHPAALRLVTRALRAQGYRAATATDGLDGVRAALVERPALVLIDGDLPGVPTDIVVAGLLWDAPDRRVLVMGPATSVSRKVMALFPYRVDFLPKPFGVADLLARVRHRTTHLNDETSASTDVNYLISGDLRLDLRQRRLTSPTRSVGLSQREFTLVRHLLRHRGHVCTRSELLAHVWGYAHDPGSNVVDVTIARLRTKLYDLHIETVRNVGYTLRAAR